MDTLDETATTQVVYEVIETITIKRRKRVSLRVARGHSIIGQIKQWVNRHRRDLVWEIIPGSERRIYNFLPVNEVGKENDRDCAKDIPTDEKVRYGNGGQPREYFPQRPVRNCETDRDNRFGVPVK